MQSCMQLILRFPFVFSLSHSHTFICISHHPSHLAHPFIPCALPSSQPYLLPSNMSTTDSSSIGVRASNVADAQNVSEVTPPTSTKKEGRAAICNPLPLTSIPHTPASNHFSDSSRIFPFSSPGICYGVTNLIRLSLQYLYHEAQRDHSPGI